MGSLMEELGKGLKELKEFAAPWREQQCQLPRPPGAPGNWTTSHRIHMEGPVSPAAYMVEDGLLVPLGLRGFDAPV